MEKDILNTLKKQVGRAVCYCVRTAINLKNFVLRKTQLKIVVLISLL